VTTSNSTDDATATTTTYSALLANSSASLAQAFTFHRQTAQGNFSGLTFSIGASSVKWSIHLHVANSSTSTSEGGAAFAAHGISLSYLLSDMSPSLANSSGSSTTLSVKKAFNSPHANMTTYYLPLSSSSSGGKEVVAEVQVFDVALIDDVFAFINHSIEAVEGGGYSLVLAFPPFQQSLLYDPSIGLGVLLGSDRDGGNGVGSDNTGLIVGVAVAVPVAVLVVIGAAVVGTAWFALKRKRTSAAIAKSLNGGGDSSV
jgi:hypothetical protein